MEKEKSSEEQPLIFQFVANNISFRLIFIIAISRDSNSEEINEIPWCFTLWEKEKKHSFQIPCNYPTCFSSQNTVAHITIKILVFDEKTSLF